MTSSGPLEPAAQAAPAETEQQLRQEIEEKREKLGETVEALAAKADVKALARSWMAERVGQAKEAAMRGRTAVAARAAAVPGQLADTTTQDRQQAAAAAFITLIVGYLAIRGRRNR